MTGLRELRILKLNRSLTF